MNPSTLSRRSCPWLILIVVLSAGVFWPGLSGGWFFDDVPNIVDNSDVQPARLGLAELVSAALSSPATELHRPLASLSFVANYALGGLDPWGWKLTNLVIHLLNGWLMFLLARALFASTTAVRAIERPKLAALLIAGAWLVLPINQGPVLLVVQRMESMANLFVLGGLIGYVGARRRMVAGATGGIWGCWASLIIPTALGLLAKETAVLLPLYALIVELVLFNFRRAHGQLDRRVLALFCLSLVLPAVIGLAWIVPKLVLRAEAWAHRDFTLGTRLLSEARIVLDYIVWTLLPTPRALSFYHDSFEVSRGLLAPWTTLASILAISGLLAAAWMARSRRPYLSLGLLLYFAAHSLTATVLPLELVYEHRNYFASFGLLLVIVPWLVEPAPNPVPASPRYLMLALLIIWWAGLSAWTSHAWGDPLRLATELAVRAPDSPRAQFAFGKALVDASGHDTDSKAFRRGFEVLERAAALPRASVLPQQTMILASVLTRSPIDERWWTSLTRQLGEHPPNSEDVDALGALTRCARDRVCNFPAEYMSAAFAAAESHDKPDAKLLAIHSDWCWSVVGDREAGERYGEAAVQARPTDSDARIALARMNIVLGRLDKVASQIDALDRLNTFGRLDAQIADLRRLLADRSAAP